MSQPITKEQIAVWRAQNRAYGCFIVSTAEADSILDALDAANAELSRLCADLATITAERDLFKAETVTLAKDPLRSSPAPVVGGVPELTDDEAEAMAESAWKEGLSRKVVIALVKRAYALATRLPALKPGEVVELAVTKKGVDAMLRSCDSQIADLIVRLAAIQRDRCGQTFDGYLWRACLREEDSIRSIMTPLMRIRRAYLAATSPKKEAPCEN